MTPAAAIGQTGPMSDDAAVLPLPSAPDAIELRHLRAFVAVAEELNFSRAAQRLFISQPALSRQIRALERFIGYDLFLRSTQRVELTVPGESLLAQTRPLLAGLADAIATTRSIGGELDGRSVRLWEPWVDATLPITDLEGSRAAVEELHSRFEPPDGLAISPVVAGGVPTLRLTPPAAGEGTVLYVHGGGHTAGSAFGYRHFAGAVAVAAGLPTLVVDYRLAPEHPFPASLHDVLAAYRWLLETGTPAEKIVIVGDSSGGGLVMSLLLTLRDEGVPMPACAALLCPWVDLAGRTHRPAQGVPGMVTPELVTHLAALYLDGHPADDPVLDPLRTDLTGLPPLHVQAASGDFVRQEAELLVQHARACGVDATATIFPVPTHDFHIFWSFLRESTTALEELGRYVRDRVGGDQARVI